MWLLCIRVRIDGGGDGGWGSGGLLMWVVPLSRVENPTTLSLNLKEKSSRRMILEYLFRFSFANSYILVLKEKSSRRIIVENVVSLFFANSFPILGPTFHFRMFKIIIWSLFKNSKYFFLISKSSQQMTMRIYSKVRINGQ